MRTREPTATPLLESIKATRHILSLSRTTIYQLLNLGDLESVKIGKRRLITRKSIDRLIEDYAQNPTTQP